MASNSRRWRTAIVSTVAAVTVLSGVGITMASAKVGGTTTKAERGVDGYGMTQGFYNGKVHTFTYNLGFFCDKSVPSTASNGCEAGAPYVHAPSPQHSPLDILIPLGFKVPEGGLDCPDALTCIDHPTTIDLTRAEPALKGLFPTLTDAQLTAALRNIALPGHDHFVDTLANNKPQWWSVQAIIVTDPNTYKTLETKKSMSVIQILLNRHDANVLGPVPTNVFLYFKVS